jgi:acyl transferase domain-containing protein
MRHPKQQQKLEALIRDLERDLSEGKSQVVALEETHKRLQESERICQELADENRRLGEEITGWQERFAKSEESQRQVSMLRQQLEALQAEHARVIDRNRQMQEKLTASSETGSVSTPIEHAYADATSLQGKIPTVAGLTADLTRLDKAGGHLLDSRDSAPRTHIAKEAKAGQITRGWIVRNWRVGAVFAGVIILVIVCAVTIKKILVKEVPISRDPIVFPPEATTVERVPEPVSKPPIKAAPRVRGAFQTVRPTQVFSGPSEDSELIANISQGTKVNVVDSKDGWLEIRSKHGRPPGFIRQEATVRIGSN